MSAVALATAYVNLVLSAKGLGQQVGSELRGVERAASATGISAGKALADGFKSTGKVDTTQAEQELQKAKDAATRAGQQVTKARLQQEDANRKAAIAEKAYAEAVAKTGADSSRAAAAEDRMILAKRKAEAASHGVEAAVEAEQRALSKVDDATNKVARAADQADGKIGLLARAFNSSEKQADQFGRAAARADNKVSGLGRAFEKAAQFSLRTINPFSGLDGKARHAGEQSAAAFESKFKAGLGGVGSRLKGVIGTALAGLGAAAIGRGAIDIASKAGDLEQSIGAIDSVFKQSAGQMHAWADSAAQAVGLSKNEFNELGTLIGAQLKNGGTSIEELAPKTNELLKLGADLSSMFGGTTREAVEALSSALKGERDPIERYGVSLKQAEIDAKAASLGFEKVGGSFSNEAQQAATLALIMEQTKDAHGNFAAESDTYAHKVQVLSQEWENFTAQLGQYLLPVFSQVLAGAQGMLEGLAASGPVLEEFGAQCAQLWTAIYSGDFTGAPFGISEDSPVAGILLAIRDAVMQVGAAFEWAAQPGGLFQTILAGVAGVFQSIGDVIGNVFLPIWNIVWATIVDTVTANSALVNDIVYNLGNTFASLAGAVQAAGAIVSWVWDNIGQTMMFVIQSAITFIMDSINNFLRFWDGVFKLFSAIVQGDWAAAWEAVKQIFGVAIDQLINVARFGLDMVGALFVAVGAAIGMTVQILVTTVVGLFSTLGAGVVEATRWLVDTVSGAWGSFSAWITSVASSIWASLAATWDGLVRSTQKAFGDAVAWVEGVWNGFWGWMSDTTAAIGRAITGPIETCVTNVRNAFKWCVDVVESIWNGIKNIAKAPVVFVIDTVMNKGLIDGFNWLTDKVGLGKPLGHIPLPAGFATGGILPGYSSWRDGDDQLIRARRGEGVVVAEALKDPYERKRLLALNDAALKGVPLSAFREHFDLPGFAGGGIIGFRGHRFTANFANRIQLAERIAGAMMHITQGGWRPRTSYSGSSHAGDALDITGGYRTFIVPLRKVGIPTWDRAGKGRWVPHAHGVPLPFAGTAGGSAVWQAQDYLRGGDGLGGRDNGPRITSGFVSGGDVGSIKPGLPATGAEGGDQSVPEKILDLVGKGFQAAWDFMTAPLKMFNEAIENFNKFLQEIPAVKMMHDILVKMPGKIVGDLKNWIADQLGIPHFANGGTAPGGLAVVGERGPELVNLPRGAEVVPNHQLRGGGGTYYVTVQMPESATRNIEDLVGFLKNLPLAVRQMGGQVVSY